MPDNDRQQTADSAARKTGRRKKWLLLSVVIAIVVIVVAILLFFIYFWPRITGDHTTEKSATISAAQEASNQQVLSLDSPPNATADQKYTALMVKSVVAGTEDDWRAVEQYAKEALQLDGYHQDAAALMKLADAQEKLGETTERRVTLEKIKQYYIDNHLTDSDGYKQVVKELSS